MALAVCAVLCLQLQRTGTVNRLTNGFLLQGINNSNSGQSESVRCLVY